MNFRNYLIRFSHGISLPSVAGIASTPIDAIADDFEVEFYTAMFLDAQGKLPSIEDLLAELRNDAD